MGSVGRQLHIFFFPFMAHGHIIPTVDTAKLFASRGLKSTIITTPLNAPLISKTIQRTKDLGLDIDIQIIKFPSSEAGLPEGCENMGSIISSDNAPDLMKTFLLATAVLQEPLEKLLQEVKPDCLVADVFFPWATDAAAKFGIPRLVFHGTNFFYLCAEWSVILHEPYTKVSSDSELFVVPNLPDEIKMTRKQLPGSGVVDADLLKFFQSFKESELKSFGVIFNSFYELEPAYADHYRKVLGIKAWHIGPVSLCNTKFEDKAERGQEATINEHECLKWLDSKKPNSVIYVCFGSLNNFTSFQLKEIAVALEASGHHFIWVVSKSNKSQEHGEEEEEEEWLPEGFEKRMEGKGLIIRGWAPQMLILEHEAVGGFLTHCGWNSTLEAITAGKPMATRPISAEQFYNEKLVTEVLKIGVEVGVKQWEVSGGDFVESEKMEKAITRIMVGEEAEGMRSRARNLAVMARKAVEEGGSSYSDVNALVQELRWRRT